MRGLFFVLLAASIHVLVSEEAIKIGTSANGHDIDCFSFGNGGKCVVVIGGMHGRYEENTVQIAGRLINYCRLRESGLGANIKIIRNLNPDSFRYGLDDPAVKINGSLVRFNGNSVDLNRNWDTRNWRKDCVYSQNDFRPGAGGSGPMSEPEVAGLADLLLNARNDHNELYVIVLHSYVVNRQNASDVFPSFVVSEDGKINVLAISDRLANLFSHNGNFVQLDSFRYYNVTGELLNWCGNNAIAAIDIEFSDSGDIDAEHENRKSHWENFIESFEYFLENVR